MTATHDVINVLCDLVALPSVNPEHDSHQTAPPYGETRVADYVEHYFRAYDLRVERQEALPGRENVLVHVPGKDRRAAAILLEAHMDTVDVQGMDAPFAPRVENGRIYGRGACDTKASLAAMMLALKELLQEGAMLPRDCLFAAVADEEFRMTGAQRLAQHGVRLAAAVVGEPTGLRVVSAHNGQVYVRIVAHGKAAHTSTPEQGVNAIDIMNDVISIIRRRAACVYPERRHSLCGSPLLTVSMIRGGTSFHVVPDACEIAVDRRLIPGETWHDAVEEVKGWVAEVLDAETTKRVEFNAPDKAVVAMETPTEHPLVQALRFATEAVLGRSQVVGVPWNTNASHYIAAGIPSVVFGPGDIAQAHSVGEFVESRQLTAAVDILKRFLVTGDAVSL